MGLLGSAVRIGAATNEALDARTTRRRGEEDRNYLKSERDRIGNDRTKADKEAEADRKATMMVLEAGASGDPEGALSAHMATFQSMGVSTKFLQSLPQVQKVFKEKGKAVAAKTKAKARNQPPEVGKTSRVPRIMGSPGAKQPLRPGLEGHAPTASERPAIGRETLPIPATGGMQAPDQPPRSIGAGQFQVDKAGTGANDTENTIGGGTGTYDLMSPNAQRASVQGEMVEANRRVGVEQKQAADAARDAQKLEYYKKRQAQIPPEPKKPPSIGWEKWQKKKDEARKMAKTAWKELFYDDTTEEWDEKTIPFEIFAPSFINKRLTEMATLAKEEGVTLPNSAKKYAVDEAIGSNSVLAPGGPNPAGTQGFADDIINDSIGLPPGTKHVRNPVPGGSGSSLTAEESGLAGAVANYSTEINPEDPRSIQQMVKDAISKAPSGGKVNEASVIAEVARLISQKKGN